MVRITLIVDPKARQLVSTFMDGELDPLIVAIVGNQVALRAIKQHAINKLKAEKGGPKILVPNAAQSISALNGSKDAKALQVPR